MNLITMAREQFDVAVIGGGVVGAGIALDAASRGLKTALVEKSDFASGTSSRSTKLIHGGLRYLEHFQFGLVRESLRERETLTRLAPHLSRPLQFLVPVYGGGVGSPLGRGRFQLSLGLTIYDLLSGNRISEGHKWLSSEQAVLLAPGLEPDGLKGCFLYNDCVTDDSRLVIELIKAAAERGAVVANYARVREIIKSNTAVTGAVVEDSMTGEPFSLRARITVNATGVWSDQLVRLCEPESAPRVRPSKGVHIVVPGEKIAVKAAVLIRSVGEDRFLFVVPWLGRTLIGTTDTDYTGELDHPTANEDEIERLIQSARAAFPGSALSRRDVISVFAGLRPLVQDADKSTTDLSRKEEILENDFGMISIIGGKLTTYRHIAERVVDRIIRRLDAGSAGGSRTARITLAGGIADSEEPERLATRYRLFAETIRHLKETYAGNYRKVLSLTLESESLKERLSPDLPHIRAEVAYAACSEMAMTVDDFLSRRTRISLLARDHGKSSAQIVAALLSETKAGSP